MLSIWSTVDVLIAVFLVFASCRMAYLGVHVTLHPPSHVNKNKIRQKFVFWGVVAVGLTLGQGVRTQITQNEIKAQMSQLRGGAYVNQKPPTQIRLTLNEPIAVNVECKNSGPEIAVESECLEQLYVADTEPIGSHGEPMVTKNMANSEYELFKRILGQQPDSSRDHFTLGINESKTGTVEGQILDSTLQKDILSGHKAILIVFRTTWKDSTGPRGAEFCMWLQADLQNWHSCEVHDDVRF